MELRHLRYFVTVAETRNLSRAAEQLRVAQPALSRQIHDLERALQVPLFVRHPKGVTLTPAGEAIANAAPQLLADLAAAIDRADATAAGRRGRVVIGAMRAFVARGFSATVQEQLRREHPEITVVVHDIDPPDLIAQLRDGSVDVALTLDEPLDASLAITPLWADPVDQALLPAGHRLSARRSLHVSDLAALPLVVARLGYPARLLEDALAVLRAAGLRSAVVTLDAGLQAAHMAVAVGRGWTMVSRSRAQALPEGTTTVVLKDFRFQIVTAVAWRRVERRPVVRTVIEKALEVALRDPAHRVPDVPIALPRSTASVKQRRQGGNPPSTLELRHLRALITVAETQTIGRAAERLGIKQPSVSRQLMELERAVGVPLLERSARGVQLTPAGASFASECPRLLLSIEQLMQVAARARRGMEGRCVIGTVATGVTSDLLTPVLAECADRFPEVQLSVEELPTPRQPGALARGEIDLGLGHAYLRLGAKDGLTRCHLAPDRLDSALVAPNHPLAAHTRLRAADLRNVPFLFVDRSFYPPMYDRVMGSLAAIGLTPLVGSTYDGLQALWAMAAQGKGWVVGFRSQRRRPPAGTVAIPIVGLDVPWGIDLIWRADERSPAVLAIARLMRGTHAPLKGQT